jgi:thiol-disulfide isomerase/thioredoxin
MKKIFTFIFAIALSINAFAQCPLTTAVDFTATDCHGTEVHLFDILDGGQYVLVDFFFTTCGPCQQATPNIVESYYSFGCNMHDVYYMEISTSDGDAACQTWAANYGVEYPTISTAGGGNTICSMYSISYYPTVILIAPDRSIVIQDLWPISNAQAVISALENHGIQQYDCVPVTVNPEVTITVDEVLSTEATITFTPNEECAMYYYTIATPEELSQAVAASGLELPEYLQTYGSYETMAVTYTFAELYPATEYVICAVPSDADGNLYEVVQETITTEPMTGELTFSTDVVEFSNEEPGMFTIYNMSQIDVWINDYQSEELSLICLDNDGNDIKDMIIAPYGTIDVYVYYAGITKDNILNGTLRLMTTLGDYDLSVVITVYDGINEINADHCAIYPNPANDFLRINGENLSNVMIFNAMGQKIGEFEINNGKELNINTSNYENGVYFVKIGGKTQRFVVTH